MQQEKELKYHEQMIRVIDYMKIYFSDSCDVSFDGQSRVYTSVFRDGSFRESELNDALDCLLNPSNVPEMVDMRLFQLVYLNLFRLNCAESAIDLFKLTRDHWGFIESNEFYSHPAMKRFMCDSLGTLVYESNGNDAISMDFAVFNSDKEMSEYGNKDVDRMMVSFINVDPENIDSFMLDLYKQVSELFIEGLKKGFYTYNLLFITDFLYGNEFDSHIKFFEHKFDKTSVFTGGQVFVDYPFQGRERVMDDDDRKMDLAQKSVFFKGKAVEFYNHRHMSQDFIEAFALVKMKGRCEFSALSSIGRFTISDAKMIANRFKELNVVSDAASAIHYIFDLISVNAGYPLLRVERNMVANNKGISKLLMEETYAAPWARFDLGRYDSLMDLSPYQDEEAYRKGGMRQPDRIVFCVSGYDKILKRSNSLMVKAMLKTFPIKKDPGIVYYYLDKCLENLDGVLDGCMHDFESKKEIVSRADEVGLRRFNAHVDDLMLFRHVYHHVVKIELARMLIDDALVSRVGPNKTESYAEAFGVTLNAILRFENKLSELESKRKAVLARIESQFNDEANAKLMHSDPKVYSSLLSLVHYVLVQHFELEKSCEKFMTAEFIAGMFERDKITCNNDDYDLSGVL